VFAGVARSCCADANARNPSPPERRHSKILKIHPPLNPMQAVDALGAARCGTNSSIYCEFGNDPPIRKRLDPLELIALERCRTKTSFESDHIAHAIRPFRGGRLSWIFANERRAELFQMTPAHAAALSRRALPCLHE
jgi:hypothetical protein